MINLHLFGHKNSRKFYVLQYIGLVFILGNTSDSGSRCVTPPLERGAENHQGHSGVEDVMGLRLTTKTQQKSNYKGHTAILVTFREKSAGCLNLKVIYQMKAT